MNGDDYGDVVNAALAPPLNRSVRGGEKLKGVKPELINHWNSLDQKFKAAGIVPEIKSGFRTAEQQNALFRNPTTSVRTKGNDGYNQISPHQRGDALDISFPANQRSLGRRIIAQYAQENGLNIPSDEPWHISLGSKRDPYADVVSAAVQKPTPEPPRIVGDQDYADIIQSAIQQPKEKVTVGAKPVEFQGETPQEPIADIQNAPKVAPVPFQQVRGEREPPSLNPVENLYRIAESTPEPSGSSQQQFEQRRFKAPESLNQGQRVKLNFPSQLNPSPQDVEAAYMKALGPEYEQYNKMHIAQTGQNLVSFHPEQLAQIKRESDGSFYISPRKDALDYLNAYVTSGGDLNKAHQVADVNRQAQFQAAKSAQEGAKQDVAEVEKIRKEQGAEGGAERSLTAPAGRVTADTYKLLGSIRSLGGVLPNDWSEHMNRRGEIIRQGASLPPLTREGQEIERRIPEKVATAVVDTGLSIAQLILLKRATKLPLNSLMAIETGLKNTDKPTPERAKEIAQSFAMGSALEAPLDRATAAAMFAVPSGVEGAQAVARGQMSKEDAILNTMIQGGVGAALSGRKPEGLTDLGIERAPTAGESALREGVNEQPTNIRVPSEQPSGTGLPLAQERNLGKANISERQGGQAGVFAPGQEGSAADRAIPATWVGNTPRDASVESANARTGGESSPQSGILPTGERADSQVRHVDLQPRRVRGEGKGQFKTETTAQTAARQAQVNPVPSSEGGVSVSPKPSGAEATGIPSSPESPVASAGRVEQKPPDVDPATLDYNRDRDAFRNRSPVRFGTANAVERRQNPLLSPDFRTATDGDFVGIKRGNKYLVYPRHGFTIEPVGMSAGAVGDIFSFPDLTSEKDLLTGQSRPSGNYYLSDYKVSRPAIFSESDGKWQLDQRGEIRTNGQESESSSSAPRQQPESREAPTQPVASVKESISGTQEAPRSFDEFYEGVKALYLGAEKSEAKQKALANVASAKRELEQAKKGGKPRVVGNAERFLTQAESKAEKILSGKFDLGDLELGARARAEQEYRRQQPTPPEAPKTKAEPFQAISAEPSPVKALSTEAPTEEAAPPTTSARKDQLAVDRAELDLPELPQAERKGWRSSLINAKEKGLDQKAERLADQVLVNPRALDDEQTAGMVLRLQQLKNEHADLLSKIDGESDATKLAQHRADLESVEQSFDKITEAVKKSGTEKGRSLASQKLTINQDFDLVSMLNRYKAKTGKEPTPEIRAQIETQQKRIAELEKQLTQKFTKGGVDRIAREVRRENRQRTRKVLDEEAATIKMNLAAEFARIKSQQGVMPSGLAGIDPEGAITKLALKYAKNRFEAGLTDATQLVDDVHGVLSEFADVTKRQVAEMVSGYAGLKPKETKEQLEKTLTDLRKEMRSVLRQADIEAGTISARPEGPRLKKEGPPETKPQIQRRFQKQINEIERRIREDFAPKAKRGPTVLDSETQKIQVNLERAKQDFQRKLREWQSSQRTRTEKVADLAVNWGRAAKLMYVSTLGKLSSAATGRMVMSPLENLIGEIPHRVMPELSRKATTEGGGFNKAAEVAALWKSGRFRQVLDQLTKGSSDLDVLLGSQKSIDKEMSRGGVLGIPGRVHGAFKEYPRQAEFDRAFIKTLKNYERQGRDIERPDVQLAARMEAFNSAERARFQQRNFVSDTFNSAMGALERKGIAGKAAAKAGRFIFPITRVPVNVVGETLNYTFGLPRAVIETAIRGGVKNLTPEQANNIMRAYKKGGVGLAVMTYAFLHPKQFGGYYQKGDKRDESEPQAGEVMFFGKRIPKIFTHVPILEAAQLAATARRVMDRMAEQGKTDSALEGGLAAGKGLAEQVPFYETPARFFTGQEGSRGIAQAGGELARGMIPGFVQETAKLRDKDAEGRPIPRSPQGSFAERFGQTVEMGIPGLRQRVPINEKIQKSAVKNRYINQMRKGQDVDLDAAVDTGKITKADKKAIEKQSSLTPFQISFDNAFPNQALDRYERLVRFKDPRAREVEDIMSKKAWSLLHSDALTQKQKDDFQVRIDEAGITPVNPQKKATKFTPSFGSRFQRLGATR